MTALELREYFLIGALIVFGLLVILSFVRAVKGPLISDRIVAINMIGTLTIIMIAVLTVLLDEGWLADVALVYAMISFISVVVVTKIYIGVYRERQNGGKAAKDKEKPDWEKASVKEEEND